MDFFQTNISLLPYNTFGFDLRADYFTTFANEAEIRTIISRCKQMDLSWCVIGGGSNIIFTGEFRGVYIHSIGGGIETTGDVIVVDAGVEWDYFVGWSVSRGYTGIENLSYIPGSVGASPVQNIGAYGAQVSDVIEWVEYFDTEDMAVHRIAAKECEFGYRDSVFKGRLSRRAIILRVGFRLRVGFEPERAKLDYGDLRAMVESMEGGVTLSNIRNAVTTIRKNKLPEPTELGNAGSFFKNPEVSLSKFMELQSQHPDMPYYTVSDNCIKIPAGWLIETAGYKGYRRGSVGVHVKQALVLVNYGGGDSTSILDLANEIVEGVASRFGVNITMEVNII